MFVPSVGSGKRDRLSGMQPPLLYKNGTAWLTFSILMEVIWVVELAWQRIVFHLQLVWISSKITIRTRDQLIPRTTFEMVCQQFQFRKPSGRLSDSLICVNPHKSTTPVSSNISPSLYSNLRRSTRTARAKIDKEIGLAKKFVTIKTLLVSELSHRRESG